MTMYSFQVEKILRAIFIKHPSDGNCVIWWADYLLCKDCLNGLKVIITNTHQKIKNKKNSPLYHIIFYQIEDKKYLQRSKKERKVKCNKASNKQAVNLAQANHMKDCGLI
jgi:hypothetical protein